MEVYTPEEVESVNGTDAKLKCTFQSSSPLKESSASVSWHFRPLGGGAEESVFFYQDGQYPPSEGRFRGRAVWAGNLNRYDGSIMVRDVQFRDNGTFVCQVKNPPDVHGVSGEIRFRVVTTASHSEIAILAAAIGGATGLLLLILVLTIFVKFWRNRRRERGTEAEGKEEGVL